MTRKPIGHDWHGSWLEAIDELNEWKARALAAEAELSSVREQIASIHAIANGPSGWMAKCKAAEARVAQLEAALGTALDYGRHKTWCAQWTHPSASGIPCGCDFYEQVSRARVLLASQPEPE